MVPESVLSFLCLLVILISQGTAEPDNDYYAYCSPGADYESNSTYRTNLRFLLSRLTSDTKIDYGFYNSSYGQDSDKVYATGLCRGDFDPDTCRSCLNNSSSLLLKNCTHQKQAVGGNGQCMLHYSYSSIFGYVVDNFRVWNLSETNVTGWDQHSYVLTNLLSRLRVKAETSDPHDPNRKFAAGHGTSPSVQTIYAAVQCQPDLTVAQCNDCLEGLFSELPKYCYNSSGCLVSKLCCNFRYENFRFYEPKADALTISLPPKGSPLPSPLPSPPTPSITVEPSHSTYHGKSTSSQAVVAKAVPAVAFVVLLIFICIYLRMRNSSKHFDSEAVVENEINEVKSSQFDFDTIKVATNNFSDANKLGQGGFGPVYKGVLSDGQEIAVKKLSSNSGQGEIEFKNEVLLMARLQHRNLVRLLGFCFERKERLLVYEFLPHRSLDCFLFDPIKRVHLDWKTRSKIIKGIARGLLYLHEDSQQRIIHRDLKASNILLDVDMNPKISDFGLAKLFVLDQTQAIASKIAGTIGYMAPEYARHGKLSVKSDVFSFGVIILEIVSGKKNSGFHDGENVEHLLSFAWKNWRKGTTSNIIDPTLDDGSRSEIERCIQIGLLCAQERVAERPTLASVLLMLNGQSFYLPVPMQPAFFMNNKCSTNIQLSDCSSVATGSIEQKSNSVEASANEASISSIHPR